MLWEISNFSFQSCTSLLNNAFRDRAPKDPPAPRRSKRGDQAIAGTDDNPDEDSDKPYGLIDWQYEETAQIIQSSDASDEQQCTRKRAARNVGGWISPNFSEMIDRSWLMIDSPMNTVDPSKYVPQVGDSVL